MSEEPHDENEINTVLLQFLRTSDNGIVKEFEKTAFSSQHNLQNAHLTLKSVGDDYLFNLSKDKAPKTTFPSIIYNYHPSNFMRLDPIFSKFSILEKRIKNIKITTRLIGHLRPIQTVSIDTEGKMLISGSQDTTLKIWHLPSLTAMQTLKGHSDPVIDTEISPDGRLLCTSSEDKFLRLWSLEDGSAVSFIRFNEEITSFSFSPFNDLIAISTKSGLIELLKLCDLPFDIQELDYRCNSQKNVDFHFLNIKEDGYINFMNYSPQNFITEEDEIIWKKQYRRESISITKFSPGGYLFAYGFTNGSIVVQSTDHKHQWKWNAHNDFAVDGIYFLKNRIFHLITWSQKAGEIKLWNLNNIDVDPLVLYDIPSSGRKAHVGDVSISCDESFIFAISGNSTYVWAVDSPDSVYYYEAKDTISVSPHPKIPKLCAVCTKTNIIIIDVTDEDGEPMNIIECPMDMPKNHFCVWNPNGLELYVIDSAGGIYVFRVTNKEPQCVQIQSFFPIDFNSSEWLPGVGQIDSESKTPVHKMPKNILLDAQENVITDKYSPVLLNNLYSTHIITPDVVYSRMMEMKYSFSSPEKKIEENLTNHVSDHKEEEDNEEEETQDEEELRLLKFKLQQRKKVHRKGRHRSDEEDSEEFSNNRE